MFKVAILLALAVSVLSDEVPSTYALLEKHATLKPEVQTGETHGVKTRIDEHHPVYRGDEHKNQGRARIQPVKSQGAVVKHDMLADEPMPASTELNRIDTLTIPGYGYPGPAEVAYPDIPYAPGYNYGNAYAAPTSYDMYANSPSEYFIEPDTSALSFLWSQVPNSRTLVGLVGRVIGWVFNSIFMLIIGSFITIGICSYTNLCAITFNGVGPIHEEMRSLITPERLEKISHAANFVKTAIDKYQNIQKVEAGPERKRRAIFK